jgi:hypothetical protein
MKPVSRPPRAGEGGTAGHRKPGTVHDGFRAGSDIGA